MSKEINETVENKTKKGNKKMKITEKTVKVTSIIKSVLVIIAIIGSFIGGMAYQTYDNNRINSEVKAQVKSFTQE